MNAPSYVDRNGISLPIALSRAGLIATPTGTFDAYAHEVVIEVLGIELETTVLFAAEPFMRRDVLGRTGWLDRIRLGLIDHDQLIYLSHYND